MDDIAKKIIASGIYLHRYDSFLIVPSVHTLQIMLHVCETELSWLDTYINVKKSECMRFWAAFSGKMC